MPALIDAIVDEIRTSRQDKPTAALVRLEQTFDELLELDPALAVRELRRIHRRDAIRAPVTRW